MTHAARKPDRQPLLLQYNEQEGKKNDGQAARAKFFFDSASTPFNTNLSAYPHGCRFEKHNSTICTFSLKHDV